MSALLSAAMICQPFASMAAEQADVGMVAEEEQTVESDSAYEAGAVDINTAAVQLRQAMVNREWNVTISVDLGDLDVSHIRSTQDIVYDDETPADWIYNEAIVETGNPKEGDYLRFQCEPHSLTHWPQNQVLVIDYNMTYYSTAGQEAELDGMVDRALSSMNLTGLTDFQKAYKIYTYISTHVNYDWDHAGDDSYLRKYSAYNAMHGLAVCQGYSTLFYRMAMAAGLKTRIIEGTGRQESHTWNIVRINGQYYNVDPTWESSVISGSYDQLVNDYSKYSGYQYFLKGNNNFANHTRSGSSAESWYNDYYPTSSTDYVPSQADLGKGSSTGAGETSSNKSNHFETVAGKSYWFENGVKQGTRSDPKGVYWKDDPTNNRGREIYDASSNAWYWLDSAYDGAVATGKEVFMPYVYQNEASMNDADVRKNANASDAGMQDYVYNLMKNKSGKWVRYDGNGKMLKGWVTIDGALAQIYRDQVGNRYYYDQKTGAMAKGWLRIDGKLCHFDETSGKLLN